MPHGVVTRSDMEIWFALNQTSAPTEEPVTRSEAKTHMRVDHNSDDSLIDNLISGARRYVEHQTNRQLVTSTWDLVLDRFPFSGGTIWVPRPPLRSVNSITYVDTDGNTQTWAASEYRVDTTSEPGRITEADGENYPDTQDVTGAVTVDFDAGYGTASDVPQTFKQAILLLVGHWYEYREAAAERVPGPVEFALEAMLSSEQIPRVI